MHGLPREQRAHLNSALPPVPCLLAVCARRRDQAKFRRAEASAVVVGSAPLRELCAPGGAAQGKLRGLMLLEEDAGDLWHDQFLAALGTAPPVVHVASSAVFQTVAGLESAEGRQAAGEVQMPQFLGPEQLLPAPEAGATVRHVVVLDRVQDPGNVGTLLRTATAGTGRRGKGSARRAWGGVAWDRASRMRWTSAWTSWPWASRCRRRRRFALSCAPGRLKLAGACHGLALV